MAMGFAGVLHGINDIRYEEIEFPKLQEGEAVVKVKCAGICGSDITRVKVKGTYSFPMVLGHEFAGVIHQLGNSTEHLNIGDKVAVYPLIPCRKCSYCSSGKENLCDDYNYLGSRCNGGFAEYVKCPARNLLKIPENVGFEDASLLEPLAVALRGVKRSGLKNGDRAVVFGLGTIGLFTAQLAKLKGASLVVGVDRNEYKLSLGRKMGVDFALNSKTEILESKVRELMGSVDVIFECSGDNSLLEKSIELVKKSGIISIVGNPKGDVLINEKIFQKVLRKEISLIGTWNSLIVSEENEWKEALNYIAEKKIRPSRIITHRFNLKDIKTVFDNLHERKYDNYCKGTFIIGGKEL